MTFALQSTYLGLRRGLLGHRNDERYLKLANREELFTHFWKVIYILLVQLKYNYQQLHDTVSVVACLNFLFSIVCLLLARDAFMERVVALFP